MLNSDHFVLLGGNPQAWDDEIQRRVKASETRLGCFDSESLCAVQVDQHARGRRSAVLTSTIYGWSVRLASGLDQNQLLFSYRTTGRRGITREEAIAWGRAWAAEDPTHREFYASRNDVKDLVTG